MCIFASVYNNLLPSSIFIFTFLASLFILNFLEFLSGDDEDEWIDDEEIEHMESSCNKGNSHSHRALLLPHCPLGHGPALPFRDPVLYTSTKILRCYITL